jgi:hypothetical protein
VPDVVQGRVLPARKEQLHARAYKKDKQNRRWAMRQRGISAIIVSLGAGFFLSAVTLLLWQPFTVKAQEAKRFEYRIVEVLPDTMNMQTKLNEFGMSGWELVAVSMGNMTEPRLIFKK